MTFGYGQVALGSKDGAVVPGMDDFPGSNAGGDGTTKIVRFFLYDPESAGRMGAGDWVFAQPSSAELGLMQ